MDSPYICIWEYEVGAESRSEFERCYGGDGIWVELFRRSEGFVDTRLFTDRGNAGRYLTLDRWRSEAAYRSFRSKFAADYARIDAICDTLTQAERLVGEYAE